MSPEKQDNWSKRHKKEIGLAAGSGLVLLSLFRAKAKSEDNPGFAARERHNNAADIASLLVDSSRGDNLAHINRMAALMVVVRQAKKPEIVKLFGGMSGEASKYMAPLIRHRLVMFQQAPKRSVGMPQYVVNPEAADAVVDLARAEPEKYATFLSELEVWNNQLNPETSGSS